MEISQTVRIRPPRSASDGVVLLSRLDRVARKAGADGFGVCDVAPFEDVAVEMTRRVADGSSADLQFTYRDPSVATDVRRTFPWAQRLVVLASAYVPEAGSPGPAAPGSGRIARFATRDHYLALRHALDEVVGTLTSAGHRAESLSDDNRLVDRAAAVRAGVGWWGKSTLVLAPGHGPWMLLGSVVTDAVLDVSPPMRRDCGTCDACLPACPTGAIVAPGVLDARRCLARWAQAPGVIPAGMREPMGDRIYGCDDCLTACPPGLRALSTVQEEAGRVDLVELLGTPDRVLLERYGHFYLPGRSPMILRRNAIVALGNSVGRGGDGAATACIVLGGYLGHQHWSLRLHAAWSLGVIGGRPAAALLEAAMPAESDVRVRDAIVAALTTIGATGAVTGVAAPAGDTTGTSPEIPNGSVGGN